MADTYTQPTESDPWLRTSDLAERWDIKRKTVQGLIRAGHLSAFKVGKEYRIRESEAARFEASNSRLARAR